MEPKRQVTLVRREVFHSLPEYSYSFPTALPVGKAWKSLRRGQWWLVRVVGHDVDERLRPIAVLRWTLLWLLTDDGAVVVPVYSGDKLR